MTDAVTKALDAAEELAKYDMPAQAAKALRQIIPAAREELARLQERVEDHLRRHGFASKG